MNISNVDLKLNDFVPIVPILTGHTQTVLGHIVSSEAIKLKLEEKVLSLDDGDQLLLKYFDNNSGYTISIYHGLAGNSQADYVRRSASLAAQLVWNIILVDHRGADQKATSKQTYHSGRGSDAEAVIKWARNKFINTKHIALGFSMSGSILLNLVTCRYGTEQPDFAVVVNAPLDLARSAHLLSVGFSKVYDWRFYLTLKKIIQSKETIPLPFLARTMDIDQLYTSKANGFKDAADYYEKCSTLKYIDRINTKTFVLAAYDDPFIDIKNYLSANWNGNAHLTFSKYGGHMGYFANKKDPQYGRRWLDHYLGSVFKKIQTI